MNYFRNRETAEVLSESDMRASLPHISLPSIIKPSDAEFIGFDPVFESPMPQLAPNQRAIRSTEVVHDANDNWMFGWNIIEIPEEETTQLQDGIRAQMWEDIKSERAARQNGGVLVNGKWFQTDEASRIQFLSLKMLGDSMPSSIQWKTMDNSFITMTIALVNQIFTSIVVKDQQIFAVAEQHRTALYEDENPGDYDFMTGWPESFGDSQ